MGGKTSTSGQGRPKGAVNKTTAALKDMILQALNGAGGVEYLQGQATTNPTAFLTLVGKVLPLQVAGDDSLPAIQVQLIERKIVDPDN